MSENTSILRSSVHFASSADSGPIFLIFGLGISRNVLYDLTGRDDGKSCVKRL